MNNKMDESLDYLARLSRGVNIMPLTVVVGAYRYCFLAALLAKVLYY